MREDFKTATENRIEEEEEEAKGGIMSRIREQLDIRDNAKDNGEKEEQVRSNNTSRRADGKRDGDTKRRDKEKEREKTRNQDTIGTIIHAKTIERRGRKRKRAHSDTA